MPDFEQMVGLKYRTFLYSVTIDDINNEANRIIWPSFQS